MAGKLSGLGGAVIVDDASGTPQTISGDVTNWSLSTPRAVQDTTGVNKSANERLLLLADVSVTLNGVLNYDANMSHVVFSSVSSTSVARTTKIEPTSATGTFLNPEILFTDYQLTRANTGEVTWQVPGSLADGTVPTWTNA